MGQQEARVGAARPWWRRAVEREALPRLLALLAVLLVIAAAALLRERLPAVHTIGYPAVLLLSFFSSASVFVPLPGIAAVCAAAAFLRPALVALLAGVGEGAGEVTGYLAGFGGRGLAQRAGPRYDSVQRWVGRRGGVVLFLLAVVPNPLFDLAGVAAGMLRFPLWRFLLIVLAGKLIKSLAVAYACHFGFQGLARYLG